MKNVFCVVILILILRHTLSAQLFVKTKELEKYALEAKDTSIKYFVVYVNGDSVKGANFVKKENKKKPIWTLDDSVIVQKNIRSYQDETGYVFIVYYTEKNKWYKDLYGDEFIRLFNGNVSLYASQIIEKTIARPADREVTTSENFNKKSTYRSMTTFFLSKDPNALDRLQPVTPKQLEEMISDYPPAVEKLKQEFKKINDKQTNDYNAIISVLKIYNENRQ